MVTFQFICTVCAVIMVCVSLERWGYWSSIDSTTRGMSTSYARVAWRKHNFWRSSFFVYCILLIINLLAILT